MTNLEFIKKNKIAEIVDDIITNAIYADNNDLNWQNELFALKWLFQEKETYGEDKFYQKLQEIDDNLPFNFDEKEEPNV